jgi:alpha-glucosidase
MKNPVHFLIVTALVLIFNEQIYAGSGKTYRIVSPDKTIEVTVTADKALTWSVSVDGNIVMAPSAVSMTINNNLIPGEKPKIKSVGKQLIQQEIKPVVPRKFAVIEDHFNELTLNFKKGYSVTFRVYNNGAAYRFSTNIKGEITVNTEQAEFHFTGDNHIYFPEETSFFSHNERSYLYELLDTMSAGRLASLPLLVETSGPKLLITESDLRDYPGMWIKTAGANTLSGVFPHYPLESKLKPGSDRNMPVTKYADYLAKTNGTRTFPWRILAIAKTDGDLITNDLVYQLGEELQIEDPAWIKPGKVAWDWWNANNVYGVDFRAGINTETYKYYIDFASQYGIDYVILDEGWYKLGNLLDVVPEIDVEELVNYGKEKGVGIILWVIWKTLDDQMEEALDQFEAWGVAGIKVDFMERDDQQMVNYYWKVAEEAAKRKMLVDFHGAYKPAGLRRAYPNVITREGVKGLEHNKWSDDITPEHNLTLPFIRMVAGPMDYTPGAMVNAQPNNFRVVFNRPMSMTTRAQQAAMYVLYDSPLQMMADSPSNYLKEKETTEFIAQIPTVWEDTRVLDAKTGDYLIVAKKFRDKWYVAAMTDENPREFTIDLSFLNDGSYTADIFEDGINADRYASDYKKASRQVSKDDRLTIKMAPGGGWVAIIKPE